MKKALAFAFAILAVASLHAATITWKSGTITASNGNVADDSANLVKGYLFLVDKATWDGFDAATLAPHGGAFVFAPDTLSRNKFLIRVPRQADESMKLTVRTAFFPKTYPLGEYIAESGFDWQKESLDDAMIFIDKATVKVEILTKEWDNGTDYGTVEF